MADSWNDRAYLRGTQYKTDTNLAARQSIYAYAHPRVNRTQEGHYVITAHTGCLVCLGD